MRLSTSIIGASLTIFLLISLTSDFKTLQSGEKQSKKKIIAYSTSIALLTGLTLLYLLNGIQHAYEMIIFAILILIYLKIKNK